MEIVPTPVSQPDAGTLPWQAWSIAGFLGFVFFLCYIQHNDFPHFYHTSEPLKVDQVLSAEYNLRHPLLMLNSARLAMRLTGQPHLRQNAVITGRTCSAFFAAGAVAALALWGFLKRSAAGAWMVGVLVGLQPGLLTAAHYLKEDPYLLFGLACTFAALALYELRPTTGRAVWLGVACGMALSGKYIGVFAIFLGVILLLTINPRRRSHLGFLLLAFALTVVSINFQIFYNLSTFHSSVGQEVELLYLDHGEAYVSWKKARYFEMLLDAVPWIFLLAAAGRIVQTVRKGVQAQISDWMFAVVPVLYLLGLSLFPKGADRYFLPVSTFLFCLAGMALVDFSRWISRRWPRLQPAAPLVFLAALIPIFCWGNFSSAWRDFEQDNRRALAEWVRLHLPPAAILATDNRVALPQAGDVRYKETGNYIPQKVILGKRFAAEAGSIEALQTRGVTHVAVAKDDYQRVFKRTELLTPAQEVEMTAYRQFYETLFANGEKVWSIKKGRNRFLHPALEIYKLPPKS